MSISLIFLFEGCQNSKGEHSNTTNDNKLQQNSYAGSSAYVRYTSFQNPDSTWGFTIFVNSRPFLHHKKIPVKKAESGFESKKDAESVARLFTNMVKAGDASPRLTKKAIDTLGIIIAYKRRS